MAISVTRRSVFMCVVVLMLYHVIHEYVYLSLHRTTEPWQPLSFLQQTSVQRVQHFEFLPRQQDSNSQSRRDPCVDSYDLDPQKPASASKSKVVLLQTVSKPFQLGDGITVRITLYNGYGEPKLVGGDRVRVWMIEESKNASSAGYVTDHGNGSYTGHLKALWVGRPVIRSAITATCEEIGVRHHAINEPGKLRRGHGIFEFSGLTEATTCEPSLNFKGEFCNFTSENYGLPWYCERPKNKGLICHDWVKLQASIHFDYTKEELIIMKGLSHLKPDIGVSIITKDKKKYVSLPSIACNKFPIAGTWIEKTPAGFFFKGKWLSTLCSYTIEYTMANYIKCLKNRRIQIIGDSTSRQWFLYLKKKIHSVLVGNYRQHRPMLSEDKLNNITLGWAPHGLPFWYSKSRNNKAYMQPPHVYLDKIPKGSNDIIIINLYVHFSLYTSDIFRLQVRALAKSVNSLMARSPDVTIAFKGFHAFHISYPKPLHDYWASVFGIILKKEFSLIRDKVIYLNCWDITVSSENKNVHNSDRIDKEMVHNALNHICRWM